MTTPVDGVDDEMSADANADKLIRQLVRITISSAYGDCIREVRQSGKDKDGRLGDKLIELRDDALRRADL